VDIELQYLYECENIPGVKQGARARCLIKKTKGENLVIIFPFGKCGNENSPPLFL
jgi:hypothetical protein